MSLFGMKYKDKIEVKKLIKEAEENKTSNKKKSDIETTTKQQILILHYLGFLDSLKIDENTKKAKLLSVLLNRNVQNIRKELTYIDILKIENSKIKTALNLKAILPLFEEMGLPEALNKIRADMTELKIE